MHVLHPMTSYVLSATNTVWEFIPCTDIALLYYIVHVPTACDA